MSDADLGPWKPESIATIADLFEAAPFRWWISGGHALEAHVGTSWRDHDDIDIGIVRSDAPLLGKLLHGWDIRVAAAGTLTSWSGGALSESRSQNNLWCRQNPSAPWSMDITIGDGDDADWIFRRDRSIRVPWPDAVLLTSNGLPYLAPELQLLFKSKNVRPKDAVDAKTVIPMLEPTRRQALATMLPTNHPWQTLAAV